MTSTAPVTFATLRPAAMRIAPVALCIVVGVLLATRVSETAFLLLAVVIGLPHGAFDHKVAQRAFQRRHGARWWQPFLAGYLALVAAMLLLWWAFPVVALAIFLLLSILHFGDQDAAVLGNNRIVRIVAHGAIPIVVPAAAHPDAIERLLAVLVPGQAHAVAGLLGGPLLMVWMAAAGVTLLTGSGRDRDDARTTAIDLILVVILFVAVPPLIAFSLYFAGIHAPRAFAAAMPGARVRGRAMIAPAILTLLGLALGALLFFANAGAPIAENIVRSAFLLLSALTVPHMWLERRARLASVDGSGVPSTN